MNVGNMKEEQMERLRKAKKLLKFGELETWQELFIFQLSVATTEQRKKIGEFARRFNKGEEIKLPLKENK